MVDPPPHSGAILKQEGIPSRLIQGIILTHCHADHDAGTFQKILEEGRITLFTTKIIRDCFVAKYAAISGLEATFLKVGSSLSAIAVADGGAPRAETV
jgi:hypothetical protein